MAAARAAALMRPADLRAAAPVPAVPAVLPVRRQAGLLRVLPVAGLPASVRETDPQGLPADRGDEQLFQCAAVPKVHAFHAVFLLTHVLFLRSFFDFAQKKTIQYP